MRRISLQDSSATCSKTWCFLWIQSWSAFRTLHLPWRTLKCFWPYAAASLSQRSALLIAAYGFKTCSAKNDGRLDWIRQALLLIELCLVKASMKLNVFEVSVDGCLRTEAEWIVWQVGHNKFNYKQQKKERGNDSQERKMGVVESNNINIIIFWCAWCRESPCILLWRWTFGLGFSQVSDRTFSGFTASWVSLLSLGLFWPSLLPSRSSICFSYFRGTCRTSIDGRS